jgi:peptidoglycan/xylan/chitin deacetylase (PgdA/CDA1 family)
MFQTIKATLRSVAAGAYWTSPHFLAHLRGRILILAYHRVMPRGDRETFVQPGMYVTPDTFERHLRFLATHFELVAFRDLLTRFDTKTWNSSTRYCVMTFDDGWLDNYRYAYPLLRAYRIPATIFLPTDLIGTREWLWSDRLGYLLDRLRPQGGVGVRSKNLAALAGRYPQLATLVRSHTTDACDSLIEFTKTISDQARVELLHGLEEATGGRAPDDRRLIDWDEAREMSRHGIEIGSHTCAHADLSRLGRDDLRRELRRSLAVLGQQGVNDVPVLSYPYGAHTDIVVAEARAAGYAAAVTMRPGLETIEPAAPDDLFRLKRIGVHDDVSASIPLVAYHIHRQARQTARVS